MGWFRCFLFAFFSCSPFVYLVHGQGQEGFISIDCGSNSSYKEPITGLNYVSDSSFVATGVMRNISSKYYGLNTTEKQLWTVRSFPQGARNCYNVEVKLDTKYLIRASFLYANYDGQNSSPEFDLHFGPSFWTKVSIKEEERVIDKEIIHTTSDHVQVCLINTRNGTPFISALELRPLAKTSYNIASGSLATFLRLDYGTDSIFTRYPDDIYDRAWSPPVPVPGLSSINTSSTVRNQDNSRYVAPIVVLSTASTVTNASAPLEIPWSSSDQSDQFYVYLYFSELNVLEANQSRIFKIYVNNRLFISEDESPRHLGTDIIYNFYPLPINKTYILNLIKSEGSTLPPILNAIEIYKGMDFSQSTTDQDDVNVIGSIKKTYGVAKNWEGDPCAPKTFAWQGLNCSYDGSNPPRITRLNLSSNGLTGEITASLSNLTVLEVLDLSNNNLSGPVLDFLANMPLLRVLNLSGNNLSGQVPAALIDKRNKGSLSLSLDGNPNLSVTTPSEKKKNNIVVPTVAAVASVIVFLILILASVYFIRRKRNSKGPEPLEAPSRQYSYSDILKMTNSFGQLLGEGGFGKVYYGRIGNTEVAVKMLSPKSAQGYREFQTEVDLLLRVHHRNLTSLVGYCNEGETKMGLVYEYMAKGNLESLLFGGDDEVLRWENRLQIALDSAQGLEYLHTGCRPPIIHRDIKSSNILLNDHLQAKLADFGISKAFPTDGNATHMTTKVVGTRGYLDPEYYTSYRLTEKSDVYSFGIVLLELITGRPVLSNIGEGTDIIQWVNSNINQGDIYSVIDPKIKDRCNIECVWKAMDIARSCTAPNSANRLTMNQVVRELKECLSFNSNQREGHQVASGTSVSPTFNVESSPLAR